MKNVHGSWAASGRCAVRPACAQAGFSVIELMVAMTVGLLLLAGLATLFANSSQSGRELEKSVRQLENGRYALELISDDIAMAGYFGNLVTPLTTRTTPDPCATDPADLVFQTTEPVQIPVAVIGLSAIEAAALDCLDNHLAGTPAVVLNRLETPSLPGSLAVQRYFSRIYYVASCNECGVDTTPTLKHTELDSDLSPLAEGIQDMAFEFGFDTDNDGEPETYRTGLSGTAGAADNDWVNVVGVRVHLLSRATETSPGHVDAKTYSLGLAGTRGPFNDGFKRRAYTLTSRLNNVAGPRELPLPAPSPAQQP